MTGIGFWVILISFIGTGRFGFFFSFWGCKRAWKWLQCFFSFKTYSCRRGTLRKWSLSASKYSFFHFLYVYLWSRYPVGKGKDHIGCSQFYFFAIEFEGAVVSAFLLTTLIGQLWLLLHTNVCQTFHSFCKLEMFLSSAISKCYQKHLMLQKVAML